MKTTKSKPSVGAVDWIDGHSFEYFCADVLKKLGYKDIKVTKGSGDNGVDIVAHLDSVSYAIQCKRYSGKVGNKAIQEIYAGRDLYGCERAIVITNSTFTEQAISSARRLGVTLWDRKFLDQMIKAAYSNSETAKKAVLKSKYQAKSKKELQKQPSGCAWIIAIIVAFFAICAVISAFTDNNEETTTTAASTTHAVVTTQSNNGGAVKGFDSVNTLIINNTAFIER